MRPSPVNQNPAARSVVAVALTSRSPLVVREERVRRKTMRRNALGSGTRFLQV